MKYNGWLFLVGFKCEDMFFDWEQIYPKIDIDGINRHKSTKQFATRLRERMQREFKGSSIDVFTDVHNGGKTIKTSEIEPEPRIIPSVEWQGQNLADIYNEFYRIIDVVYKEMEWLCHQAKR